MAEDFPDDHVLTEIRSRLGIVTLNRPKALNALSLGMVDHLLGVLDDWKDEPEVEAVLIRGAGKAFCAGGDVRAVATASRGEAAGELRRAFFHNEYVLNYRINSFPKPFVALIGGIVMGGGAGISVHGSHRIADENTLFAMPETVLGLFPDVGASWFLNRCPGETGLYLALTGQRLKAADMLALGLATHYVPSARTGELVEALIAAGRRGASTDDRLDKAAIDLVLAEFAEAPGPAPLAAQRAGIDEAFAADTVEGILAHLERIDADWAREALAVFRRASPLSLKITLRELRAARGQGLAEALRTEFRLAVRVSGGPDFAEGVRAILIDKDNKPRWKPDRLDAVRPADLDPYFAPFGDSADELDLA